MRKFISSLFVLLLAVPAFGQDQRTFVVNEYFGMKYDDEPVSFDVTLDQPRPANQIGFKEAPSQVEILEGDRDAVSKARLWVTVDFDQPGQQRFTLVTDGSQKQPQGGSPFTIADAGDMGGVNLMTVDNGVIRIKAPLGDVVGGERAGNRRAVDVPGPVVSIARNDERWIGRGYLEAAQRVRSVTARQSNGPVYHQVHLTYHFNDGATYTADVRLFRGKPYVTLSEDFNLGGAAKFIFNFEDWPGEDAMFFLPGDQNLSRWMWVDRENNPAGDFIQLPEQKALARMVVWSQFNYFGGKQETLGVMPDPIRARAAGETSDLAVGAFYIRPDRWTRAKVNHVDLYERPEVPGAPLTRGEVGLAESQRRIAMEAWLVDGHREWAIFAVDPGDWDPEAGDDDGGSGGPLQGQGASGQRLSEVADGWRHNEFLAKAHVVEGVWPLDRINRLPLVWNPDGSSVTPEQSAPGSGDMAFGGDINRVLKGTRGRSGLQHFNGSNGSMRGGYASQAGSVRKWAEQADFEITPENLRANERLHYAMVGPAMAAYMAMDESAYPGTRAMLPWTHPEALNPFYQGMENQKFNADRYNSVAAVGAYLKSVNHPEGDAILGHGQQQMDMALDTYVYPQSGTWEESHTYAAHTLKNLIPLADRLNTYGLKNFYNDPRFASMYDWWTFTATPRDPGFGDQRITAPVGDHGVSVDRAVSEVRASIEKLAAAEDPAIQKIAGHVAWFLREKNAQVPGGIEPIQPNLSSRFVQGFGSVLRSVNDDRTHATVLRLNGALHRTDAGDRKAAKDLKIIIRSADHATAAPVDYNTGEATVELAEVRKTPIGLWPDRVTLSVSDDKWVKGGEGAFELRMDRRGSSADEPVGTFTGTWNGQAVEGAVTVQTEPSESFLIVRAGQSWGHHHQDKGSLWGWFDNVHFFGDAAWGGPPGGTYWNKYKQGPASGTQIELVGVNNWTLPAKYPAPWISDDAYHGDAGYDYVNARCMYPFNPELDLSESTPVALRNGYDRQVLFVHPNVMIVRDNIETVCDTIWRLHSYQVDDLAVFEGGATMPSPQGVVGELRFTYPRRVELTTTRHDDLNDKYHDDDGEPLPVSERPTFGSDAGEGKSQYDTRSAVIRYDMPKNTSTTWVFSSHDADAQAAETKSLDEAGRVTRVTLDDGTTITALLNIEPFSWQGEGIDFHGTVGLVIERDGERTAHRIRAERLTVE